MGSAAIEDFEREVLARDPRLAEIHAETASAGALQLREFTSRAAFPSWPGATSVSTLRRFAQEAEVAAILDAYAAAAGNLIRAADRDRWEALVAEDQRQQGQGVIVDELGRSTIGASLLRTHFGGPPRRPRQRQGIDCAYGYAIDGVHPKQLCPECGDLLLRRWVAEERRLLRAAPSYAEAVMRIIELTAQKQAKVYETRGDYLASEASAKRRAGGRQLARLQRRHRTDVAAMDLTRWTSFIEPLSREMRTGVRTTAAKAEKRGLGAAALTELSLLADKAAIRVASNILAKRKNARR